MGSRLILGINSARLTTHGLIAITALLPELLAGSSAMVDRKIMIYIDKVTARECGIDVGKIPADTGYPKVDRSELKAKYAGAQVDNYIAVARVFDLGNVIPTEIHDVGTVLYIMSVSTAKSLEVLSEDVDNGLTLAFGQGNCIEAVISMLKLHSKGTIEAPDIAALLASDKFDVPPTATHRNSPEANSSQSATA